MTAPPGSLHVVMSSPAGGGSYLTGPREGQGGGHQWANVVTWVHVLWPVGHPDGVPASATTGKSRLGKQCGSCQHVADTSCGDVDSGKKGGQDVDWGSF